MNGTDDLLDIATRYSQATGRALATVASLASNDGKTFARISAGGDITVRRLETVMRWFSDNWPDGVEWPENIKRPEKEAA